MRLTLGAITSSLAALQGLRKSSDRLAGVQERLASGLRINHASDDPAGLAVAAQLELQTRTRNQGIRNINDGISLFHIADGALEQLEHITVKIKELASQAANGSYTRPQRQALNSEANALQQEYNRIIESVHVNKQPIFDPAHTQITLQFGPAPTDSSSLSFGATLPHKVGDGTFSLWQTVNTVQSMMDAEAIDADGDQFTDLVLVEQYSDAGIRIFRNTGTEFQLVQTIRPGINTGISGEGRFTIATKDFNGDGYTDIAIPDGSGDTVRIFLANGDGTYGVDSRLTLAPGSLPEMAIAGDFNGDGQYDLVVRGNNNDPLSFLFGNGDGTFRAAETLAVGSITPDGLDMLVADFNGDGLDDVLHKQEDQLRIVLRQNDGTSVIQEVGHGLYFSAGMASGDIN